MHKFEENRKGLRIENYNEVLNGLRERYMPLNILKID